MNRHRKQIEPVLPEHNSSKRIIQKIYKSIKKTIKMFREKKIEKSHQKNTIRWMAVKKMILRTSWISELQFIFYIYFINLWALCAFKMIPPSTRKNSKLLFLTLSLLWTPEEERILVVPAVLEVRGVQKKQQD